jgi:hypothetical protein
MTHTEEYEEEYAEALKELTSICEYCEQEYLMVKATQKYCSSSCKSKRYYRDRRLSER